MDKNKTISVIGLGMVGGTVYKYYLSKGYTVKGWSPSHQLNTMADVNESDYIFICVPTPFDWKTKKYDLSILEETLQKINGRDKKVIIKSTVPPTTTIKLQEKYNHLLLFFNPEFLSEATAQTDFINPDRQVVGYTPKSYYKALEVLHILPLSPHDVLMTSTEAEIIKYVNNFHGALMVIFSNFIYDVCNKTNSNFERVKKTAMASKWVGSPMGRMYWDVLHGGFRGYGGKCFPKDINNLIKWCKENKIDAEILLATQKANVRILKSQNLDEQKAEKISKR
jgi:UDPglucose 6-dehydrogenase